MTEEGAADGEPAAVGGGSPAMPDGGSPPAAAGDSADAPPPPPGVPDATETGRDALRGTAAGMEARVDDLSEIAEEAREKFEVPDDPDQRALAYCRHGLWPVLAVYVDRRGARAQLGQPHHDRLESALNTWLELYAQCYGAEISVEFSVREAAELFVSTHNVRDVAQLLTDVPER